MPKNHINKKCAHKLLFFIEKKIGKIQMIFVKENSLWKSNFGTFLRDLALRIYKKKFLWLSAPHGTSNFVYPKMILHNRSHVTTQTYYHVEFLFKFFEKMVNKRISENDYPVNIHSVYITTLYFYPKLQYDFAHRFTFLHCRTVLLI